MYPYLRNHVLRIELKKHGFSVQQQHPIKVLYEEENVGEYFADLVVNNVVTLELKAVERLAYEHECQLLNYLKATSIEVGLLLNFGVTSA